MVGSTGLCARYQILILYKMNGGESLEHITLNIFIFLEKTKYKSK